MKQRNPRTQVWHWRDEYGAGLFAFSREARVVYSRWSERKVLEDPPRLSKEATEDLKHLRQLRQRVDYSDEHKKDIPEEPDAITLGVSQRVFKTMERINPDVPVARQIYNARIIERCRRIAAREFLNERLIQGKIRNSISQVFQNLWNDPLGTVTKASQNFKSSILDREGDLLGSQMKTMFGDDLDYEAMAVYLRKKLNDSLKDNPIKGLKSFRSKHNIPKLKKANAEQLRQIRDHFQDLPARNEDSFKLLDRLVEFQDIVAEEYRRAFSFLIYDHSRLGKFLDVDLVKDDIGSAIKEQLTRILRLHELGTLEKDPQAMALVDELQQRYHKDPEALQRHLKQIEGKLPVQLAQQQASDTDTMATPNVVVEDVEKMQAQLLELHKQLLEQYEQTKAARADIVTAAKHVSDANNIAGNAQRVAFDKATTAETAARNTLTQSLLKLQSLEALYMTLSKGLLEKLDIASSPAQAVGIQRFYGAFNDPPALTVIEDLGTVDDSKQTFQPGMSKFEEKIREFSEFSFTDMQREITRRLQGTTRISSRQLLWALHHETIAETKTVSEEEAQKYAFVMSQGGIAMAENAAAYSATNDELAQYLGGTLGGSNKANQVRKRLKAERFSGEIYTAKDALERITGTDPDMAVFRDVKPDMTPEELVDYIERKNVTSQQLSEFKASLIWILRAYNDEQAPIELYDVDAPLLEQLIDSITFASIARAKVELFDKIREDFKGSPLPREQIIFDYLEGYEKKVKEEEKGVLEKVKDIGKRFIDSILGKTQSKKLQDVQERAKNEGIVGDALKELLAKEGLTVAAGLVAGGGAKKTFNWLKGKGKSGIKASGGWFRGKLRSIRDFFLRDAWRADSTDSFFMKTAKLPFRIVQFPFKLLGAAGKRIKDWFVYKPGR